MQTKQFKMVVSFLETALAFQKNTFRLIDKEYVFHSREQGVGFSVSFDLHAVGIKKFTLEDYDNVEKRYTKSIEVMSDYHQLTTLQKTKLLDVVNKAAGL